MPEAATKVCSRCGQAKALDQFPKRERGSAWCGPCWAAYNRQWKAANRERLNEAQRRHRAANPERYRAYQRRYEMAHPGRARTRRPAELRRHEGLKRHHGMTPEQYDALLAAQGGVCAACGALPKGYARALHVDHDHAHDWSHRPGQKSCPACWRGLLCDACNKAAGMLGDDPERAEALATYLRARQRPELIQAG